MVSLILYTLHRGIALTTTLPMVICLFVGCMCDPCKRKRSPVKIPQFREPIVNSLILCRALRELFPVWSAANGQALRSWILSMPASIRGRLDLLPRVSLFPFCLPCTTSPFFVYSHCSEDMAPQHSRDNWILLELYMRLLIHIRRVSRKLKSQKKVTRANFKLFHLYYATLFGNIIFSAIFWAGPRLEKLKGKKKSLSDFRPPPLTIPGHATAY